MNGFYLYVWCVALVIGASGDDGCTTTVEGCVCRDNLFQCFGLSEFPDPPIGMHPLRLSFSECTFNEITDTSLPMMYHQAETLIIHHSEVTHIQDRVFHLFTDLTTLSLENNFLTNVTKATLSGLDRLETLNLNSNRLGALESDVLTSTPALKELELGHNENLLLPDEFFDESDLESLRLSFCSFETVPHILFDKLPNLKILHLSGNPFHSLGDYSFSMLPKLQLLSLGDCGLQSLSHNVFIGLNTLEILALSNNNLSSLDPAVTLPFKESLWMILLDNNQFQTLSEDVTNWNNLEDIKLGHNQWHCDCHLHWIHTIDLEHLDGENITCSSPSAFADKGLEEVASQLKPCDSGHSKSAVALGIMLPLLILCALLIGYYAYRIYRNRREREMARRSYNYSAVYRDTVEQAGTSKTPPPRPPAPNIKPVF